MSLYVNSNIASLNAQRNLSNSTSELQTSYQRLASGKRINGAADDALVYRSVLAYGSG